MRLATTKFSISDNWPWSVPQVIATALTIDRLDGAVFVSLSRRAPHAQRQAGSRCARLCKLERDDKAAMFVIERLSGGWPPEAIAGHLSRGVEPIAYVCHEAIYTFIYAASQAKEKLWECLVRRRKKRIPRTA